MMSRANVIDGLVAQLRLTNGFEATNSGTALAYDHRALAGGVDRAAVVLANEGTQERLVIGGMSELKHDLDVELYIRHNNDIAQARRDADVYGHNIIARINANPTLGGSAFDAYVASYRVEDERFEIGRVAFLKELLTVRATEDVTSG